MEALLLTLSKCIVPLVAFVCIFLFSCALRLVLSVYLRSQNDEKLKSAFDYIKDLESENESLRESNSWYASMLRNFSKKKNK